MSRLKTLIQEIFKIEDRNRIKFETKFNIDFDINIRISINIDDKSLFVVSGITNKFCCGIIDLGDTIFSTEYNNIFIDNIDEELKNKFYTLYMEQVYRMLVKAVKDEKIKNGLAIWTHINVNDIVTALKSEFAQENSSWKLNNEFVNPNTQNTVCQFSVNINT